MTDECCANGIAPDELPRIARYEYNAFGRLLAEYANDSGEVVIP